jgi:hypothetical protein
MIAVTAPKHIGALSSASEGVFPSIIEAAAMQTLIKIGSSSLYGSGIKGRRGDSDERDHDSNGGKATDHHAPRCVFCAGRERLSKNRRIDSGLIENYSHRARHTLKRGGTVPTSGKFGAG